MTTWRKHSILYWAADSDSEMLGLKRFMKVDDHSKCMGLANNETAFRRRGDIEENMTQIDMRGRYSGC
jgi:hypothetical protein